MKLTRARDPARRRTQRRGGSDRGGSQRDGRGRGGSERDDVAIRLHAAAIHLLRRLRREDVAAGLGPARLSALSVLVFGGPCTLGELAAAEQVSAPTMSRLVAALEAEGLVRRSTDRRDARVVRLRASAAGRRRLEEGRGRRVAELEGMLGRLEPDERALLGRAAALIEQMLAGAPER